jgi:hypothetical protein
MNADARRHARNNLSVLYLRGVHSERFPFPQLELTPFQFGANSIHKRSHLQRKKRTQIGAPCGIDMLATGLIKNKY